MDTSRPAVHCEPCSRSFNGATTFQPWIPSSRPINMSPLGVLQWSHDLSAMDTAYRFIAASVHFNPSMEPRPFSHGYRQDWKGSFPFCLAFNGATTFQPWIRLRLATCCCRGQPFNGATTFQPWIRLRLATCCCRGQPFNGATTFQPWIRRGLSSILSLPGILQWSHDLSAMDTAGAAHTVVADGLPSMEPRPFSHGYVRCEQSSGPVLFPFNGATTFQPWIPTEAPPASDSVIAFNGATTFQPWIPRHLPLHAKKPDHLQWSHDLSAMDTMRTAVTYHVER